MKSIKNKIKNFFRRNRCLRIERCPGSKWNQTNRRSLEEFASLHFDNSLGPEHGPEHWKNVEYFGATLWALFSIDSDVIQAFAFLHDIERKNNLDDIDHGPRAALLVDEIRDTVLWYLGPRQIRLLKKACKLHTNTKRTLNRTVNACFDADRLDLPRCGIIVDPERLATNQGRVLLKTKWYKEFWERRNKNE